MKLKDKIYQLRVSNDLSKTRLSRILGCTTNSISNWESGFCKPNDKILSKLSNLFLVTKEELSDDPEQELDVTCYEHDARSANAAVIEALKKEILENVNDMFNDILSGMEDAFDNTINSVK